MDLFYIIVLSSNFFYYLKVMHSSLRELQRALKGLVVLSAELGTFRCRTLYNMLKYYKNQENCPSDILFLFFFFIFHFIFSILYSSPYFFFFLLSGINSNKIYTLYDFILFLPYVLIFFFICSCFYFSPSSVDFFFTFSYSCTSCFYFCSYSSCSCSFFSSCFYLCFCSCYLFSIEAMGDALFDQKVPTSWTQTG